MAVGLSSRRYRNPLTLVYLEMRRITNVSTVGCRLPSAVFWRDTICCLLRGRCCVCCLGTIGHVFPLSLSVPVCVFVQRIIGAVLCHNALLNLVATIYIYILVYHFMDLVYFAAFLLSGTLLSARVVLSFALLATQNRPRGCCHS